MYQPLQSHHGDSIGFSNRDEAAAAERDELIRKLGLHELTAALGSLSRRLESLEAFVVSEGSKNGYRPKEEATKQLDRRARCVSQALPGILSGRGRRQALQAYFTDSDEGIGITASGGHADAAARALLVEGFTHLAGEYQRQQARWTVTTSACGMFDDSVGTSAHHHVTTKLEQAKPTSSKGVRRKEDAATASAPIHGQHPDAQPGDIPLPLLAVNSMETHSPRVEASMQRTLRLSPRPSPVGLPVSSSPSPSAVHRRRVDTMDSNADGSSISPRHPPPPPPPSRQASTALPVDAKSDRDGKDGGDSKETNGGLSLDCGRDDAGGQASESALSPPRPPPPPPTRQPSTASVNEGNDGGGAKVRDVKDPDRRYSAGREVPSGIEEGVEQAGTVVGGGATSHEGSAMNGTGLKVDAQGFLDLGALQKEPSPPRGAAEHLRDDTLVASFRAVDRTAALKILELRLKEEEEAAFSKQSRASATSGANSRPERDHSEPDNASTPIDPLLPVLPSSHQGEGRGCLVTSTAITETSSPQGEDFPACVPTDHTGNVPQLSQLPPLDAELRTEFESALTSHLAHFGTPTVGMGTVGGNQPSSAATPQKADGMAARVAVGEESTAVSCEEDDAVRAGQDGARESAREHGNGGDEGRGITGNGILDGSRGDGKIGGHGSNGGRPGSSSCGYDWGQEYHDYLCRKEDEKKEDSGVAGVAEKTSQGEGGRSGDAGRVGLGGREQAGCDYNWAQDYHEYLCDVERERERKGEREAAAVVANAQD